MKVQPLTVENVYKQLYNLNMNIAIFKYMYDKDNYKLDKARRRANIYSVKNTWRVYNLLLKEYEYQKGQIND